MTAPLLVVGGFLLLVQVYTSSLMHSTIGVVPAGIVYLYTSSVMGRQAACLDGEDVLCHKGRH